MHRVPKRCTLMKDDTVLGKCYVYQTDYFYWRVIVELTIQPTKDQCLHGTCINYQTKALKIG